jgi:hypothetical protein
MTESQDQQPSPKLIVVIEKHESLLGTGITGLRAKKDSPLGAFAHSVELFWYNLLNPEDRPIKYNKGLQLPLAKLYKSGDVCLDRYVGVSELLGEELVCKFTYHRAGVIQVADGADVQALLDAINAKLDELKYGVAFELE